jgi:hypothetical protein
LLTSSTPDARVLFPTEWTASPEKNQAPIGFFLFDFFFPGRGLDAPARQT